MKKPTLWAAFAVAACSGPALARMPCPMTYPAFELAVPHLDLDACPADLARDKAFCRATAANDAVHVFVFAGTDDQCLLALRSYEQGRYQLIVK